MTGQPRPFGLIDPLGSSTLWAHGIMSSRDDCACHVVVALAYACRGTHCVPQELSGCNLHVLQKNASPDGILLPCVVVGSTCCSLACNSSLSAKVHLWNKLFTHFV